MYAVAGPSGLGYFYGFRFPGVGRKFDLVRAFVDCSCELVLEAAELMAPIIAIESSLLSPS